MKVLSIVSISLIMFCNADCPYGHIESGVPPQDQEAAVNKHNEVRLLIANDQVPDQPRGVNLKRLSWDDALAAKAQEIADTCVFAHVSVTDDRWSWVGQNLYMTMSTGVDGGSNWDGVVQGWFDEHNNYHYPDNSGSDTGHYTQVVWANTEKVGCGYTFFETDGDWRYRKLYVCNYGPGGNWQGEAPYETGDHGCENLC